MLSLFATAEAVEGEDLAVEERCRLLGRWDVVVVMLVLDAELGAALSAKFAIARHQQRTRLERRLNISSSSLLPRTW